MTRRTIVYTHKTTGKIFASAEFNGDRTEFEMFGMSGSCDADWEEIEKEFSGVTTLMEFIEANERAQKHYKPCGFYCDVTDTVTEPVEEIQPIYEVGDISEIKCDYIIHI